MATNHDEAEAVQEKTYKPQRPLSAELLSFNTAGLPLVINFPPVLVTLVRFLPALRP